MFNNFVVIKIFLFTTISFILAFFLTPLVSHFLYKFKLGKQIRETQPTFYRLHKKKAGTPTMGGVIIWLSVLILALATFYLSK